MVRTTFTAPQALKFYLDTRARENARLAGYNLRAVKDHHDYMGHRHNCAAWLLRDIPDRLALVDFILKHTAEGTLNPTAETLRSIRADRDLLLAYRENARSYKADPWTD